MSLDRAWPAYAAGLWALIFALLHVVWACGWYVGLDPVLSRQAFQQRWFLAYDLVVAALCALAAWVALGLVRPWGARLPRGLLSVLARGATVILTLRGAAGALQTLHQAALGRDVLEIHRVWEAWFCLGAVLFGISTWRFGSTTRRRNER